VDIIDPGKTGLLFDTSDPSDLADKIVQTLSDPDATQKRVDAARDHVKKYHTIDVMGRNIIRIYRLHQIKLDRRPF
jgi:glycosyltransferase involved in cell wall biosynthesis